MESGAVLVGTSKLGQQAQLAAAPATAAPDSLPQHVAKAVASFKDATAPDAEPTSAPAPAPTMTTAGRNGAQPPESQPTAAEQPNPDARLAAAASAMGWGARAAKPGRCPPLGPQVAAAVATNSTIIFTCAAHRLLLLPVARVASLPPAPISGTGDCQPAVGECCAYSPSLRQPLHCPRRAPMRGQSA